MEDVAESSGQASQRRANWIGLRTLRQHPKYVGETKFGEPIYEVRSVRLTLRPDGSHFHLLTECARCGREVAGSQVFTTADLDRPSNPVICTDCVRKAGVSSYRPRPAARPSPPARTERAEATVDEEPSEPPRPAPPAPPVTDPDAGRLAVAEAQIQALLGQVRELAEVVRAESLERRRATEETRRQVQEALQQHLGEVRTSPDAADDVRRSMGAIVEAIQGQRGDIATLAAALAEAQQEIRRVADSGDRLAVEQGDLRAHMAAVELPGPPQEGVTEEVVVALVEPRLQQVHASLGATVEARLADAESTVANGLAQARFEIAALQERLDAAVVTLTNQVESRSVAADPGGGEHLAQLRAELQAGLQEVAARVQEEQGRVRSVVAAESDRLRALEERTELALNRLAQAIEARREVPSPSPTPREVGAPEPGSGLLDALEQQLAQAADRLALLTRPRRGDGDGNPEDEAAALTRPSGGAG